MEPESIPIKTGYYLCSQHFHDVMSKRDMYSKWYLVATRDTCLQFTEGRYLQLMFC